MARPELAHAEIATHAPCNAVGLFQILPRARRNVSKTEFLRDWTAKTDFDLSKQLALGIAAAVFLGQHHCRAQRAAPRDDRHLVERFDVRRRPYEDGVAGLVVGRLAKVARIA